MSKFIQTNGISHIRLIVTDVKRSQEFYTSLLNFKFEANEPPGRGVILSNGNMLLGLTIPWDDAKAETGDSFSPNRVGLDHLSFKVSSRRKLDEAAALFKERGVVHGEIRVIKDTGANLSFEDPDGIQLELTGPDR